jgi:ssDNA thymidine ADP-ribosyltransferase, DarT
MPGSQPTIVCVYRIVHIDNVEYLLTNGMFTRSHAQSDPNYINIGDSNLIEQRNDYPVSVNPPNGNLGEYVPFYFGPLSPMLLNIKTGYRGISKRSQAEIVYIVCQLGVLVQQCAEWCFTDGHAKNAITEFCNNIGSLHKVDWNLVRERHWSNTEDDIDRMRRKQAEFLVKDHVSVSCISCIVVQDTSSKTRIDLIMNRLGLVIPVKVNPGKKFYY